MRKVTVSIEAWEPPKRQDQKLCDGEGASIHDGLSAKVPMCGEASMYEYPWHKKIEGPAK